MEKHPGWRPARPPMLTCSSCRTAMHPAAVEGTAATTHPGCDPSLRPDRRLTVVRQLQTKTTEGTDR